MNEGVNNGKGKVFRNNLFCICVFCGSIRNYLYLLWRGILRNSPMANDGLDNTQDVRCRIYRIWVCFDTCVEKGRMGEGSDRCRNGNGVAHHCNNSDDCRIFPAP